MTNPKCPDCGKLGNREDRMKKVLWITDDQSDSELYSDEDISFTLLNKFEYLKGYDLILVDYGFLGGRKKDDEIEKNNIEVLRKYYLEKTPIFWTGGLSHMYVDECKRDFPRIKFLHNIESFDLHDIVFWVSDYLKLH
ncbi:unnamed protein product, partial [marine sediment metagenome]